MPFKAWAKRGAKILTIAFAGLLACSAIYVVFWFRQHGRENWVDQPFDQAAWQAATPEQLQNTCARGPMYRDLVDRYLKPGTPENIVRLFLGPPFRSSLNHHDQDMDDGGCLLYDLGHCEWFSQVSLAVCFNAESRVSRVWHESYRILE